MGHGATRPWRRARRRYHLRRNGRVACVFSLASWIIERYPRQGKPLAVLGEAIGIVCLGAALLPVWLMQRAVEPCISAARRWVFAVACIAYSAALGAVLYLALQWLE
jgi:hypothetical protein